MTTFDRSSNFYSGQGVVLIAERNADGTPKGFIAQGDVSKLQIANAATVQKIKETQSGQRSTAKQLETVLEVTLTMAVANHSHDTVAKALRGGYTTVAAGSVTGEAIKGYAGAITALGKLKLSSVAIKRGAQALTAYVNDSTVWDYKLNTEAGSIQINDGLGGALVDKLTTGGTAPTVITVGATTTVTVANTASAGDKVVFSGFAGADAALINGKAHTIVSATSTQVVIDLNTTGKTITLGTPLSFFDGGALAADYSYAAQYQVDALTSGSVERYLRFEGLNTLDSNAPVIVEVFKFELSPSESLDLINDEAESTFTLTGSVLYDALQTSGSKYYRERLLR